MSIATELQTKLEQNQNFIFISEADELLGRLAVQTQKFHQTQQKFSHGTHRMALFSPSL